MKGIILIAIGAIILRVIYKSGLDPTDSNFDMEDMKKYSWLIANPQLKMFLKIGAIILIVIGLFGLF